MLSNFKKYGWAAGLAGVALSSLVGALITNRFIAEKLAPPEVIEGLPPPGMGARYRPQVPLSGDSVDFVPPPPPVEEAAVVTDTRRKPTLKEYEIILIRNLFDSEHSLQWPDSIPLDGGEEGSEEAGGPEVVPLALRLFSTVVASPHKFSWASLSKDEKSAPQEIFSIDDDVYGMGRLKRVRREEVVIVLPDGEESIVLLYKETDTSRPDPKLSRRASRKKKEDDGKPKLGDTVRKLGENRYEIDQSEILSAMNNMDQLARGARIVPSFENGEPVGFKVFRIKKDSLYSKLGVRNGDIITKVNGFEINSTERALQIYQMLRTEKNITLDVIRRGSNMSLDYTIR